MVMLGVVITGLIATIFSILYRRERLRFEAIVYLIVKERFKSKNKVYWNKKSLEICQNTSKDVYRFISNADSSKLYSDGYVVFNHAKSAGMDFKSKRFRMAVKSFRSSIS